MKRLVLLLLLAAPVQAAEVCLTWEPSPLADTYRVQVGTAPGVYDLQESDPTALTSVTVPNLQYATDYYLCVIATNSDGDSPCSAEVTTWARPSVDSVNVITVDAATGLYTLEITGQGFRPTGVVYVDDPAVTVVSSLRVSTTRVDADLLVAVPVLVPLVADVIVVNGELAAANCMMTPPFGNCLFGVLPDALTIIPLLVPTPPAGVIVSCQ